MSSFVQSNSLQEIKQIHKTYKKGYMNNTFKIQKKDQITYHLPAYLRLKIKNIVSMDLFTLSGQVNCAFILSIYYAGIQEETLPFLFNQISLAFHKSGTIILDDNNIDVDRKNDQNKKLLTFTIRKTIATRLEGEIFFSPFQTVKFIISLNIRTLRIKIANKLYVFKFNFMDCQDKDIKFSLADEQGFGFFKIADNQLQSEYSNNFAYSKSVSSVLRKKRTTKSSSKRTMSQLSMTKLIHHKTSLYDDQKQPFQKITEVNNFQYGHFILSAYKKPDSILLTIYFPLILLGIINIGIFYQNNKRTGKIELNICALIVSFIALLPTVRQNTAVSPTVTFTEIMVFSESFTTILTLAHMLKYQDTPQFEQNMAEDGLAIACVFITSFVAFSVLILSLLHQFLWKPKYNRPVQSQKKEFKFQHKKWYNKLCDQCYSNQIPEMMDYLMSSCSQINQKQPQDKLKLERPQQIETKKQFILENPRLRQLRNESPLKKMPSQIKISQEIVFKQPININRNSIQVKEDKHFQKNMANESYRRANTDQKMSQKLSLISVNKNKIQQKNSGSLLYQQKQSRRQQMLLDLQFIPHQSQRPLSHISKQQSSNGLESMSQIRPNEMNALTIQNNILLSKSEHKQIQRRDRRPTSPLDQIDLHLKYTTSKDQF